MPLARTNRRVFIAALGSATTWPLKTRAQQRERIRRIGIFMPGAADNSEFQDRNAAFLQALAEKGWAVGRNTRFDYRWGQARSSATELSRRSSSLSLRMSF